MAVLLPESIVIKNVQKSRAFVLWRWTYCSYYDDSFGNNDF